MHSSNEAKENWIVGYCYTINSVIGAGILGLPWAYSTSGWLLGILAQFFALLLSIGASYQILSAWSRVEAIVQLKESGHEMNPVKFWDILRSFPKEGDEILREVKIKPVLAERKFDLYEMTSITLGKFHGKILILVYIISTYPCLVAYLSIFSISLASNIPLFGTTCNLYEETSYFGTCKYIYWGYLAIFSGFILIMSCYPIREHKHFQVTLTIFRIIVITIMILTSLSALLTDSSLESSDPNGSSPETLRIDRLGRIFFIVIFASLYENIIPTATSFVKNKAQDMPKLINSAIATFNLLYVLTGLVLAFSIKNPSSMASLNWRNYSAGQDQSSRSWWTYIISYLVVLLPAFDLISSYPIMAFNFSDNLMSIAYGVDGKKNLTRVI